MRQTMSSLSGSLILMTTKVLLSAVPGRFTTTTSRLRVGHQALTRKNHSKQFSLGSVSQSCRFTISITWQLPELTIISAKL
ncbi:hypothetical protein LINPERHAP1_LOCUS25208 [Linum perenne]